MCEPFVKVLHLLWRELNLAQVGWDDPERDIGNPEVRQQQRHVGRDCGQILLHRLHHWSFGVLVNVLQDGGRFPEARGSVGPNLRNPFEDSR